MNDDDMLAFQIKLSFDFNISFTISYWISSELNISNNVITVTRCDFSC